MENVTVHGRRSVTSPHIGIQGDMFPTTRDSSGGIIVRHLSGYDFDPERYKIVAAELESWGFQCLRSSRGADGKFWEMWFLPGPWAAAGDLRSAIDKTGGPWGDNAIETAIRFIQKNPSFDTMDIVRQVAAMKAD